MLANLATFALTALFISMVPGQGVAMVLRQGIVSGPRIARISILGNSTGLLIWSAASALGLSAIFAVSQIAFEILRWSGVAYLAFISAQTLWSLRKTNSTFDLEGAATSSVGGAYRVGLITNLTNAKAMVFALALLPQYVPNDFNLLLAKKNISCDHREVKPLARPPCRSALAHCCFWCGNTSSCRWLGA